MAQADGGAVEVAQELVRERDVLLDDLLEPAVVELRAVQLAQELEVNDFRAGKPAALDDLGLAEEVALDVAAAELRRFFEVFLRLNLLRQQLASEGSELLADIAPVFAAISLSNSSFNRLFTTLPSSSLT